MTKQNDSNPERHGDSPDDRPGPSRVSAESGAPTRQQIGLLTLQYLVFALIVGTSSAAVSSFFTSRNLSLQYQLNEVAREAQKRNECRDRLLVALAQNHLAATDAYYQLSHRGTGSRSDYSFTRSGMGNAAYAEARLQDGRQLFMQLETTMLECSFVLPVALRTDVQDYLETTKGLYAQAFEHLIDLRSSADVPPLLTEPIGPCGSEFTCPQDLKICAIELQRCKVVPALLTLSGEKWHIE